MSTATVTTGLNFTSNAGNWASGQDSPVDTTQTNDNGDQHAQIISTAGTVAAGDTILIPAPVGTLGILYIRNNDAANMLTLSYDENTNFAAYAFAKIPPKQGLVIFPVFPSGKTIIVGKATTAPVSIFVEAVPA